MAETASPKSELFTSKVIRDSNFARFYADSSFTDNIGTEIEVTFLDLSVKYNEVVWAPETTQPQSVKKSPETTELCRVRLDTEAAYNLCFNLLLKLYRMGDVSLEVARANLDRMVELKTESNSDEE